VVLGNPVASVASENLAVLGNPVVWVNPEARAV
jgi:hypothetical protein